MNKFATLYGYNGLLPFIGLCILSFMPAAIEVTQAIAITQIAYAAMIASFLAGVHWHPAITNNNTRQLTFAMIPSIIGLFCVFFALLTNPIAPLIVMAFVMLFVYIIDCQYLKIEDFPQRYFRFRGRLTLISFTAIFMTACGIIINT